VSAVPAYGHDWDNATYTLQALLAGGYRSEAGAWRDWLLRSIAGQPETLQILYSIDGARRLPEVELPWLSGYEGSSPVRTGNAASGQLQLDVWGETLDALFLARQAGLPANRDAWALQAAQRQLGNTPQAFSHFALVVSALQLHMGRTARSDNPMPI
jgi:GH15 family glucan-1,4-alpha-glucosidase